MRTSIIGRPRPLTPRDKRLDHGTEAPAVTPSIEEPVICDEPSKASYVWLTIVHNTHRSTIEC